MSEVAYGTEALEDGVYSLTTTTHYNAAAQPLTSVQKQLISQLSALIESKSVFVSERGLTSVQWTEYSEHTKRVQYSTVPTRSITSKAVTVDGVVRSQKDTAGITTTATRSYTANGMVLTQTDGRGNTTTTVTDKAGRALMVTDAAYTYTPYGEVSASGDVEQPIQWSSEFNDTEHGLVYYNYRHYNPVDGRWMGRDIIFREELFKLCI